MFKEFCENCECEEPEYSNGEEAYCDDCYENLDDVTKKQFDDLRKKWDESMEKLT